MPNPLNRVNPKASILLGNVGMDSPLNHNPELALYAMDVVRTWSDVENFRLGLYMEILGKNNENARVAFLALDSEGSRSRSINAVAERAFQGDVLKAYFAVQKYAKKFQKTRNKVCHWTWGFSPQIKDGFLLVDPNASDPEGVLRKHLVYVFKKEDFVEAIKGNQIVAGLYHTLKFICMGHVANRDGELEVELIKRIEDLGIAL
jgi:hypothetical protein